MQRTIIVVCKTTGMTLIYFIQSVKKNENLLFIQDFVTWLALQYCLEIKII